MTTQAERAAADVGVNLDDAGPFMIATVTTHDVLLIPTSWYGKYLEFSAVAGSGAAVDIAIRFAGSASVEASIAGVGTVGDGDPNPADSMEVVATTPHLWVPAGGSRPFRVPADGSVTHFAHESSATTGYLHVVCLTGSGATA